MDISVLFRSALQAGGALGQAVLTNLETMVAHIQAWSNVEHNEDGTHLNVTATSLVSPAVTTLDAILNGNIHLTGSIDVTISGTVTNWAPTGYLTSDVWNVTVSGGTGIISGIAGGTAGRLLLMRLVGTGTVLQVLDHHAGSLAINRVAVPNGTLYSMGAGAGEARAVWFYHTGTEWVIVGPSTPTPYSPPLLEHVRFLRVALQTIPTTVFTLINWDSVAYSQGSFPEVGGVITCPAIGGYLVEGRVLFTNNVTGIRATDIYLNGVPVCEQQAVTNGQWMNVSQVVPITALTDTIQILTIQTSGGNLDVPANIATLNITRVW